MEKCDESLADRLGKIMRKDWDTIESFLNITLFQIFYSIEAIKSIYPHFIHRDLFIRNVLMKKVKHIANSYIRYKYNNYVYDVPASNVYVKINDFGICFVNKEILERFGIDRGYYKNEYQDYWNILYDIYDGGNLGGKSAKHVIETDKGENRQLRKLNGYFSQFMNIKNIEKIITNDKKNALDWEWGNTLDSDVVDFLGVKTPDEYMEHFVDIFPYDSSHKIVEEYQI